MAIKIHKLGSIIFFVATLILFLAGTVFTALHRFNPDAPIASKPNILAIAGGAFLTVGELGFIYVHALINSRELWRKITAYVLAVALCLTITFAACTEAAAFMDEGNIAMKAKEIATFSTEQQKAGKSKRERSLAIKEGQQTLKETLASVTDPSFTPLAINFCFGLIVILTCTLIQPREPWKRRKGNVMNDEVRGRAQSKIGFIPDGATAYDDGRGDNVIIKHGRNYLGSIPKKDLGP